MTKVALFAGLALLTGACTSLRPIEAPREEVQRRILSEGLLEPGDRVRLVTADGMAHEFRVARVDVEAGVVSGGDETVRIADVTRLEKREVSALKTGLLIGIPLFGILTADCTDNCNGQKGLGCCS